MSRHEPRGAACARLEEFDVLRGLAMVLVVVQHSYFNADPTRIPRLIDLLVWRITDVAAVGFLAISGAVLAHSLMSAPAQHRRTVERRYARRALVLLVGAHVALGLASYASRLVRDPVPPQAQRLAAVVTAVFPDQARAFVGVVVERFVLYFPITDTIAVCMLVSPWLIRSTRAPQRLGLVAALLLGSMLARAWAGPGGLLPGLAAEAMFGALGESKIFWFPLAPWLGIFLCGSLLGEAVRRVRGDADEEPLQRSLRSWAFALFGGSALLVLLYKILKRVYAGSWSPDVFRALYPGQITALLPAYLAVLLWLFAALVRGRGGAVSFARSRWALAVLGRTSLFAYALQYLVVLSLPAALGLTGKIGLGGYCLLTVAGLAVVWSCSYVYGRLRDGSSRGVCPGPEAAPGDDRTGRTQGRDVEKQVDM